MTGFQQLKTSLHGVLGCWRSMVPGIVRIDRNHELRTIGNVSVCSWKHGAANAQVVLDLELPSAVAVASEEEERFESVSGYQERSWSKERKQGSDDRCLSQVMTLLVAAAR